MAHVVFVAEGTTTWQEAAVAGSPDGIVLVDGEGRIRQMNATAERILRLQAHEAMGRSIQEFVPDRLREAHAIRMAEFLATAIGVREMAEREPVPAVRADGEAFMAEIALISVPTEFGHGAVCIIRDATPRLAMEAALVRAEKLESLRVLSAGLAHDFNNILAAIIGNAEFSLPLVEEDSPVRLALHDIREAGRRAAEMVQQMLRFAGRADAEREPLDLTRLVREMLAVLRGAIGPGVHTLTDFADEPLMVVADAVGLRQIVMNLVINASEAMSERGGTLTIRTGREHLTGRAIRALERTTCQGCGKAVPGDYAVLAVSDTGVGMDAATRERIFDPYFSTKFTGRGLGLSAVAGIVSSHRGIIRVASRPGRGTTFQVYVPLME